MTTVDGKKISVAGEAGHAVDKPAGLEGREAPGVEASPAPVVAAEADVRDGAAAVLSGADEASAAPDETPEEMFKNPARVFLVIEDIPPLNRRIGGALKEAGASENNVLSARDLAQVTALINDLREREGVEEVVAVCDMSFPQDEDYDPDPKSGIEAIRQLQAYAAESCVRLSIIFNSGETSLRHEDRMFIDAAKAGDTGGNKGGAFDAIRAMFEARVSKAS